MRTVLLFVLLFCIFSVYQARPIIPDEEWGYFQVNKASNSNIFWWLYGSTNSSRDTLPLVLWLQGGPGASSMFGDFAEIGPLDVTLKPRKLNWLSAANVIFVDSPVGTGWSYTTNKGFSTSDAEVSANLIEFLKQLTQKYTWAQTQPFWIFAESYGGKAASFLGVELDTAITSNNIKMNFRGVGLGDSWIAPIECMASYGTFLESASLIDGNQAEQLNTIAKQAQQKLAAGEGAAATQLWSAQQSKIIDFTNGVDLYDYLRYNNQEPDLDLLMNNAIRRKLGSTIPTTVKWGSQSNDVFQNLIKDFLKPATRAVEMLLNRKYQVAVYAGQLDIIVDVVCVNNWVEKLSWSGATSFFNAPRTVRSVGQAPVAAVKKYQNLQVWNILNASHMVPMEAPVAALAMLNAVLSS